MVDYGIGGFYAERAREVNGPGYYDLKFGSETVADPSQDGFGVDRKDEGVKGGVFLNCNIASLTQRFTLEPITHKTLVSKSVIENRRDSGCLKSSQSCLLGCR